MWTLSDSPLIGSVMQKFNPCRGKDISQSEVETEKIYTGGCPTIGWEPKHLMHSENSQIGRQPILFLILTKTKLYSHGKSLPSMYDRTECTSVEDTFGRV